MATMRPPLVRLIALPTAALALGWCAPLARAAGPGLIVVPHPDSGPVRSYFKLRATRGGTVRAGTLELRNSTRHTLNVALSAVDGQTLPTLGSSYAPAGGRSHGAARWLLLGKHRMTLAPGKSAPVTVTVAVPATAQAGDYLAGVSVEALGQQAQSATRGKLSIASATRYVIGVETTLPGPRHPLIRLTGASVQREPAGLTFFLHARNPGNVILQGVHGEVRIAQGRKVLVSRPIEAGTFISGTNIAYPVPAFGNVPAQGTRYRVNGWMQYPGGVARLSTTVTFGHRQALIQRRYSTAPQAGGGTAWWKIALGAGVVLYGLATTTLLLRRRARPSAR
jgi:hypothetical protein